LGRAEIGYGRIVACCEKGNLRRSKTNPHSRRESVDRTCASDHDSLFDDPPLSIAATASGTKTEPRIGFGSEEQLGINAGVQRITSDWRRICEPLVDFGVKQIFISHRVWLIELAGWNDLSNGRFDQPFATESLAGILLVTNRKLAWSS